MMQSLAESELYSPADTAALVLCALDVYSYNKEAGSAMLEYLKGPEHFSAVDQLFIDDRFYEGNDYIPRSYFAGATPENDYIPTEPYTVMFKGDSKKKNEETITLYARSAGSDDPREIVLHRDPATGKYYAAKFLPLLKRIKKPSKKVS